MVMKATSSFTMFSNQITGANGGEPVPLQAVRHVTAFAQFDRQASPHQTMMPRK